MFWAPSPFDSTLTPPLPYPPAPPPLLPPQALAKSDPEFYKYLQQTDQKLLSFGEGEGGSDEDEGGSDDDEGGSDDDDEAAAMREMEQVFDFSTQTTHFSHMSHTPPCLPYLRIGFF